MNTPEYENGKIFKEIDFQIMICKEKIANHKKSIKKAYKMAGMNGPAGISGIDYSREPTTRMPNISLAEALKMAEHDNKCIEKLETELRTLRRKKKKIMNTLNKLEGIEYQIFFRRIIMCDSQEIAADKIGISRRHLQRLEKKLMDNADAFTYLK